VIIRRSRVVGLFALATFVVALGLPLVARHAFGDDIDVGWGEQPISFGQTIAKIGSPRPPRTDEHCALCHWGRALRASVTAESISSVAPVAIGAVLASRSASSSSATVPTGSPRGPPASL
jgi:hypothetical protein